MKESLAPRVDYYVQLRNITTIPLERAYLDNEISQLKQESDDRHAQALHAELVTRSIQQQADMDLIRKNLSQKLNASYQDWLLSQEAPE